MGNVARVATIIIVTALVAGGLGFMWGKSPPTQRSEINLSEMAGVCDLAMAYIRGNHPEVHENLKWTLENIIVTDNEIRCEYTGTCGPDYENGENGAMVISRLTSERVYNIFMRYHFYRLDPYATGWGFIWTGTVQDETVTETSYNQVIGI